jgi:hypothetical protein
MLRFIRVAAAPAALALLWPALVSAQATKAGVVTTLEGNVTVTRVALAAPQALKFRDEVYVDDKIATGDQSIARMLLGGKAVVTVRERSTLTITEVPGRATVHLESGKIALAVAKEKMRPGDVIEIRAANAVAGVRGTVVVAEVSSASAQVGGGGGLTGTFWVLKGQIDAFLTNVPGSQQSVSAFQQFRGGVVSSFTSAQLGQILGGLRLSRQPLTGGGSEQANETAVNSAVSLAGAFTGVVAGPDTPTPPPPAIVQVPILPNNSSSFQPTQPTPPPSQPPSSGCGGSHSYHSHGG